MGDGGESYPLPENRPLADVAIALRDTGKWGWIVDHREAPHETWPISDQELAGVGFQIRHPDVG